MARFLKPLVRSGGYYPSRRWTPLVYPGGYTTANGGEQPEPEAVLKTVTGSLIHITDALALPAKALSVNVEPIQDLHGYDSPWPAGGGKNKFDVSKMVNTADITVNNGIITVTGNSKNSGKKLGELADLVVGETYTLTATTDGNAQLIYLYGTGANIPWSFGTSKTITQDYLDALVFFYGGANATSHISDMMTRLTSVTDATFAPYSNICPISGWDGVEIYDDPLHAGVIEWNQHALYPNSPSNWGNSSPDVISTTVEDGALKCEVLATSGQTVITFPMDTIVEGHKYLVLCSHSDATIWSRFGLLDNWTACGEAVSCGLQSAILTATKTATSSIRRAYVTLQPGTTPPQTVGTEFTIFAVSMFDLTQMFGAGNEPATVDAFKALFPSDYYAYNAGTETLVGTVNGMDTRSISISFGSTVYSGTLDVLTGVVTVDRRYTTIGAESVSKVASSNYANFQLSFADGDKPKSDQTSVICISSAFKGYSFSGAPASDDNYLFANLTGAIRVKDTANAGLTSNEWKKLMADVQLCYFLATPITITLTPTQIDMLLGENNLWSDAGDSTLTYYADGNASDEEALNILLGGRYVNNHGEDEPTDREALDILLGR